MASAHEQACYPLITQAAAKTGLEWWLIYGVIEQESAFDPNSESGCGALGLMQLMPGTFPSQTRAQLLDPPTNVALGSEFLRECIGIWRQESADEAVKFGLASYNGGSGYVLKAQALAQAAGENTALWAVVETHLPEAVVQGKRPDVAQITDYVHRIWSRYERRRGAPVPGGGEVVRTA